MTNRRGLNCLNDDNRAQNCSNPLQGTFKMHEMQRGTCHARQYLFTVLAQGLLSSYGECNVTKQ